LLQPDKTRADSIAIMQRSKAIIFFINTLLFMEIHYFLYYITNFGTGKGAADNCPNIISIS